MPLVFVHGVNVRNKTRDRRNETARDALFRNYALTAISPDPSRISIENPYWGQFGSAPAWDFASLPDGAFESFGSAEANVAEILNDLASDVRAPSTQKILLTLARMSLERAVDCLWTAAASIDAEMNVAALAQLSAEALRYARNTPNPDWLDSVNNDAQFVDNLLAALESSRPPATRSVEDFGAAEIWDHLQTTIAEIVTQAARFVINPPVRSLRPWLNAKVAIFIGDIFVYLKTRGEVNGGAIVNEVTSALRKAHKALSPIDNKLVLVAHSLGGIISYDVLTSYAQDIQVDLFLTVGSQVGLFEELKL